MYVIMLEEILISSETSNFFKLFVSENNKPKPIRIFINNIILPFGLEEYKNKYIITKVIPEYINRSSFVIIVTKSVTYLLT